MKLTSLDVRLFPVPQPIEDRQAIVEPQRQEHLQHKDEVYQVHDSWLTLHWPHVTLVPLDPRPVVERQVGISRQVQGKQTE